MEVDILDIPIVITLPEFYKNENEAVLSLIDAGAGIIHLRKPETDTTKLRYFLESVYDAVRPNLTIHYNYEFAVEYELGGIHGNESDLNNNGFLRKSISCHSWKQVLECYGIADYVFLSPLFDSISKPGYKSSFNKDWFLGPLNTKEVKRPFVVGLGGITENRAQFARNLGFEGIAAIGSIWDTDGSYINIDRTVANFRKLKNKWQGKKSLKNL